MGLLPSQRLESRSRASALGHAHRSEADEAVTVNLKPSELALWRKLRSQFKGTPHQRLEAFRHYQHDHSRETIRAVQGEADKRSRALIAKENERRSAFVNAPCRPPFRVRTKAACDPTRTKKQKPKWARGLIGRAVPVPCDVPHRFRTKSDCFPKAETEATRSARARRVAERAREEDDHAFAGLLG